MGMVKRSLDKYTVWVDGVPVLQNADKASACELVLDFSNDGYDAYLTDDEEMNDELN